MITADDIRWAMDDPQVQDAPLLDDEQIRAVAILFSYPQVDLTV